MSLRQRLRRLGACGAARAVLLMAAAGSHGIELRVWAGDPPQ